LLLAPLPLLLATLAQLLLAPLLLAPLPLLLLWLEAPLLLDVVALSKSSCPRHCTVSP
jgi:hypothetical protein